MDKYINEFESMEETVAKIESHLVKRFEEGMLGESSHKWQLPSYGSLFITADNLYHHELGKYAELINKLSKHYPRGKSFQFKLHDVWFTFKYDRCEQPRPFWLLFASQDLDKVASALKKMGVKMTMRCLDSSMKHFQKEIDRIQNIKESFKIVGS